MVLSTLSPKHPLQGRLLVVHQKFSAAQEHIQLSFWTDYYTAPDCSKLCSSGSGSPKANGTQECSCFNGIEEQVVVTRKAEDHTWRVNDGNEGSYSIVYISASGSSNGYTFDISYVYYTGTCYSNNRCSDPRTTISTSLLPTPTSKNDPVHKLRVTINGKTAIAIMTPHKNFGSKTYSYSVSWDYGNFENYFNLKEGQSTNIKIEVVS